MGMQSTGRSSWGYNNPQSGGPSNGLYSTQTSARQQSTGRSFNPQIPGMSSFDLRMGPYGPGPVPGGPQPSGGTGLGYPQTRTPSTGLTGPGGSGFTPDPRVVGLPTANTANPYPQYGGGYESAYKDLFPGFNFDPYYGTNTTFQDLVNSGTLSRDQVLGGFGTTWDRLFDPTVNPSLQSDYQKYVNDIKANTGSSTSRYTSDTPILSLEDWVTRNSPLSANVGATTPLDPQWYNDAVKAFNSGGQLPGLTSVNGQLFYPNAGVEGNRPSANFSSGGASAPGGLGSSLPNSIPNTGFLGPNMDLSSPQGIASFLGAPGASSTSNAPGINQLSSSLLNGNIFSAPTSSGDYGQLRDFLSQWLQPNVGGINAAGVPAPQSLDQLASAQSPFFQNMYSQLEPAFSAERQATIDQAKESAGNLTGSGLGNIIGTNLNRTLAGQQAQIANLINEQAQNEGNRQLQVYNTQSGTANANAQRLASLFGALGTAGVSPNEIISQSGLGALIGPLLGALGNSGLGSGLASLGSSLASGLTGGLGSLAGGLGDLGGALVGGLGSLAGGLGSLGGSLAGGLGSLGGSLVSGLGSGFEGLTNAIGSFLPSLGQDAWKGVASVLANIPNLGDIIGKLASGLPTDISAISSALKNFNIDPGQVYGLLQFLAKSGVIRGSVGNVLGGGSGGQQGGGFDYNSAINMFLQYLMGRYKGGGGYGSTGGWGGGPGYPGQAQGGIGY